MKRALLTLAVVALSSATGCGRRCNRETLTLNWTFVNSAGQAVSCEASGATTLRVLLDGVAAVDQFNNIDFTCAEIPNGIQLFDVPVGANTVEIDAFDASGGLIIQDQQTVQVQSCGDTAVALNLSALTGNLTISYAFSDGGPCSQAGSLIWYELLDNSGQVVDVVDLANGPTDIACGNTIPLTQLPFGRYTVSRIEEVSASPAFGTLGSTCTAQSFEHLAANETATVSITVPSAQQCFP